MNFNWWIKRIEAWEKELKEMKKALKTYERKNKFIRKSRKSK